VDLRHDRHHRTQPVSRPQHHAGSRLKTHICRYADRDIWTRLMNDTGMFTLMSEAQRKAWDTQLYSDDCPEITSTT
jgi:hypothetical protein